MNKLTIEVVTADGSMVCDYEAQACGVRRFINRTLKDGVYVKNDEPSVVFRSQDILRAIQDGDLMIAPIKQDRKVEKTKE